LGGGRLLYFYSNSLIKLLTATFPNYEWLPWKFQSSPRDFWTDVNNQRKFMEWAAKELKIKEMSDWYQVTLKVGNFWE
jgi:hypothetical protein